MIYKKGTNCKSLFGDGLDAPVHLCVKLPDNAKRIVAAKTKFSTFLSLCPFFFFYNFVIFICTSISHLVVACLFSVVSILIRIKEKLNVFLVSSSATRQMKMKVRNTN